MLVPPAKAAPYSSGRPPPSSSADERGNPGSSEDTNDPSPSFPTAAAVPTTQVTPDVAEVPAMPVPQAEVPQAEVPVMAAALAALRHQPS